MSEDYWDTPPNPEIMELIEEFFLNTIEIKSLDEIKNHLDIQLNRNVSYSEIGLAVDQLVRQGIVKKEEIKISWYYITPAGLRYVQKYQKKGRKKKPLKEEIKKTCPNCRYHVEPGPFKMCKYEGMCDWERGGFEHFKPKVKK